MNNSKQATASDFSFQDYDWFDTYCRDLGGYQFFTFDFEGYVERTDGPSEPAQILAGEVWDMPLPKGW